MTDTPESVPVPTPDPSAESPAESMGERGTESSGAGRAIFPLRIWPAALLLVAIWVMRSIPFTEQSMAALVTNFLAPLGCLVLLVLWWLFASRASWKEKLAGLIGLLVIAAGVNFAADKSVRGFGMLMFALPWGLSAFAAALIVCRVRQQRTLVALAAALVSFGYWGLVRTDEIRGDFQVEHNWRWEPTAEDLLLKSLAEQQPAAESVDPEWELPEKPAWPEFRGPGRNGVQPDVVLAEDWSSEPPRELWRTRVGPGWSSFAVAAGRLFTQEQRGDFEAVVCYDAETGAPIWTHEVETRFWEVVGGAGPRATPTLADNALYALGANGTLSCLDPKNGAVVWEREIRDRADRSPPPWGFASSPLVTDGVVVVHAGGDPHGVLAWDAATGEPRWSAPAGDHSYSSPQLTAIAGQRGILMLTNTGLTVIAPQTGAVLLEHEWPFQGYRVVQPLVLGDDSVLLGTAMGGGTQRAALTAGDDAWTASVVWETNRMNPYYNDYVAHEGSLYGFDNNIFACVDLETGDRRWKRGRYGNGQVLLLPRQDQLLVISEDGVLVLLRATPDEHVELAEFRVLEGRTWNHPVLVGDRLYVRNSEEAACFVMPLQDAEGKPLL